MVKKGGHSGLKPSVLNQRPCPSLEHHEFIKVLVLCRRWDSGGQEVTLGGLRFTDRSSVCLSFCLWANPTAQHHSLCLLDCARDPAHRSPAVAPLLLLLLSYRQGGSPGVRGHRETEACGHIHLSSLLCPTPPFSKQWATVSKAMTELLTRHVKKNDFSWVVWSTTKHFPFILKVCSA